MKKNYLKIVVLGTAVLLSLTMKSQVRNVTDGTVTEGACNIETLEELKVRHVIPNTTGAAIVPYQVKDGNVLKISLSGLSVGRHMIVVKASYGTNEHVLFTAELDVKGNTSADATSVSENVLVVGTYGDGAGFDPTEMQAEIDQLQLDTAGKADGSAYAVEEQGDPAVRDVAAIHGSMLQFSSGATTKFAIDQSGNLVLYNEGTPVVLTPAKLAQLIA